MIIGSDAGPLHYLVLIGQIELLPCLYGQVVVPVAIVNELQHLHTPALVRTWIGTPPTWLDIRNTKVDSTGTPLGVGLAAITLAEQRHKSRLGTEFTCSSAKSLSESGKLISP